MKKLLKLFILVIIPFSFGFFVVAEHTNAQSDISIMPEWADVSSVVSGISQWWKVWDNYNSVVKQWNMDLWQQLASWVMSWDTILDYGVYLVKFLWQVALLVWAVAIIYLWYEKILKSIKPEQSTKLWKVIIWILVIIFAYVIVKLIWSAFIS